jgi:hypothetical protein
MSTGSDEEIIEKPSISFSKMFEVKSSEGRSLEKLALL